MTFWDSFWPNLWANSVAALLGVAAGLPIALAVDRWIRRGSQRTQDAANVERLSRALEAVTSAVEGNLPGLQELRDTAANRQVPLSVRLNAAVWGAVRHDVVDLLKDPALQVQLATYFEDLGEMARLQRHLVDVVTGVGATISGVETLRDQLFQLVERGASGLLERSRRLAAEVQTRRGQIKPEGRNH